MDYVNAVLGADYYIRAKPSEGEPDVVRQSQRGGRHKSLDVGAAESELGVRERIDDRIGLQVAIAQARVPIPELQKGRRADGESHQVAVVAATVLRIVATGVVVCGARLEIVDRKWTRAVAVKGHVVNEFAVDDHPQPRQSQEVESSGVGQV